MMKQYLTGVLSALNLTALSLTIAGGATATPPQLKKFSYKSHQYMIMSNGFVIRDNSLNIGIIGPDNKILPIVETAEDKAAVAEANEGYATAVATESKPTKPAAAGNTEKLAAPPTLTQTGGSVAVTFHEGAYEGDVVTLDVDKAVINRADGTVVAQDAVGGKNTGTKLGNFLKKESKELAVTAATMGSSGDIQGVASGNIEVTYPNGAKESVPSDFSTVNTSGRQKMVTAARYRFGPSAVEITAARKAAREGGRDIESGFLDRVGRYAAAVTKTTGK